MIEVRLARREDSVDLYALVEALACELGRKSASALGGPEELEKLIFDDNAAEAIIAFLNEEPAGCCIYINSITTAHCRIGYEAKNFYVFKHCRRQGVGTEMLKYMQRRTKETGRLDFEITYFDKDEASCKFFEKQDLNNVELRRRAVIYPVGFDKSTLRK